MMLCGCPDQNGWPLCKFVCFSDHVCLPVCLLSVLCVQSAAASMLPETDCSGIHVADHAEATGPGQARHS